MCIVAFSVTSVLLGKYAAFYCVKQSENVPESEWRLPSNFIDFLSA